MMKHDDAPGLFEQPVRPFRFDSQPTHETTNEPVSRATMAGRVAAFFKAQPNAWIDGRDLARVAGAYAWRTRVSDIRRPPFNMDIRNRQRREGRFTISEYCWRADGDRQGGAA